MIGAPAEPWPLPGAVVSARLADERAQSLTRLDGLEHEYDDITAASINSNADDEHDPEGPTIAFERSQLHALIEQVRHHLTELDAAGARLAEGSYGSCLSCGQPISAERLDARPIARHCVPCASR